MDELREMLKIAWMTAKVRGAKLAAVNAASELWAAPVGSQAKAIFVCEKDEVNYVCVPWTPPR